MRGEENREALNGVKKSSRVESSSIKSTFEVYEEKS